MTGWIKIHRAILDWEWYNEPNTLRLFLHLLLNANHEPTKWQGIDLKAGELIIGRKKLAKDLKLTEQKVRTSLQRLKTTNEITIKSTNKFSIVTICKWNIYQLEGKEKQPTNNQQITIKQPTNNQQITTVKEVKNLRSKEFKKKEGKEQFNFRKSLLNLGVEKQIVEDWLKVRKDKKATNTETAFKGVDREIKKAYPATPTECIKMAVEKSWKGFKSDWYYNEKNHSVNAKDKSNHSKEKLLTDLENRIRTTMGGNNAIPIIYED